MSNDFYNPILDKAGILAHEYGVTISDAMTFLVQAGNDEALVRRLLKESAESNEAKAARKAGRQFDLIAYARELLASQKS